jgi:hypothetical protein
MRDRGAESWGLQAARSGRGRRTAACRQLALCLALLAPLRASAACVGDCDGGGSVAVNELITGVNIALGRLELARCPAFETNDDGRVTIGELIAAVNAALSSTGPAGAPEECVASPIATVTATALPPGTPTATLVAVSPTPTAPSGAAMLLGPTSYQSFADSPFSSPSFSYFHREDFEDNNPGTLPNTPGIGFAQSAAGIGRVITGFSGVDSVDADDGAIDGSGASGTKSFYVGYSPGAQTTARFTFDAAVLGQLPTHAGVVWTDVGFLVGEGAQATARAAVVFEAFDVNGESLGQVGPVELGDGEFTGQTAEDRFFGVIYSGGVSAIELTTLDSGDWELDHVQYGR